MISIDPFQIWFETKDWTHPRSSNIAHVSFFGQGVLDLEVDVDVDEEEIKSIVLSELFAPIKERVEGLLSRE